MAWVVALTAASLAVVTLVSTLANLERECASAFDDLDPVDLGGSDADDDSADVDLELPAVAPVRSFEVPLARVSGLSGFHERTRGPERSTAPPERPPSLGA